MNKVLEVNSLNKYYRSHWTYSKKQTLNNISFSITEGESLALLGVNGAGKTTTIKCILDLVKPSSGEILFDRKATAYLPEQPYFYQHLSVRETLKFFGELLNIPADKLKRKIEYSLSELGIESRSKDKVKDLSKGLQQRLGLAQLLLGDPKFIILDEPFSGLDPLARIEIREFFKKIKGQGTSLLLCTHILSDLPELVDNAIILAGGEVKKQISLKDKSIDIEKIFAEVNNSVIPRQK